MARPFASGRCFDRRGRLVVIGNGVREPIRAASRSFYRAVADGAGAARRGFGAAFWLSMSE